MIAFVGSMATQAFGYGSWSQLRMLFAAIATSTIDKLEKGNARVLTPKEKDALQKMRENVALFENHSTQNRWSQTVGMSLIDEVLESWKGRIPDKKITSSWPLDDATNLKQMMRVQLASHFRDPKFEWALDRQSLLSSIHPSDFNFDEAFNVPKALWNHVGIRRFVTSNYDFELERVAMLNDCQKEGRRNNSFAEFQTLRASPSENFSWDLGSGRIRRVFEDGWAIESDVLNRERIDRMIEFAVGTDDVNGHILHLHGRACNWRSMIVSLGDYDNQYRMNDLNRAPFEFAKRLMFGGNPMLFVGLGMSEAELNTELQEFISNNPYQRVAPTFLIWSAGPEGMEPKKRAAKRLDLLRRLGVLMMFDTDFSNGGPCDTPPKYESPNKRYEGQAEEFQKDGDGGVRGVSEERLRQIDFDKADFSNNFDLRELRRTVDFLRPRVDLETPNPFIDPTVRELVIGRRWRSMAGRIAAARRDKQEKPVLLWEVDQIDPPAPKWLPDLVGVAKAHNLVCVIGPQGCGKGFAARHLAKSNDLSLPSPSHRMLVNGGFSFDTDTLLDGIARFLDYTMRCKDDLTLMEPASSGWEQDPKLRRSRAEFFNRLGLTDKSNSDGQRRGLLVLNGMERFFDLEGRPLSAELDQLLHVVSSTSDSEKSDIEQSCMGGQSIDLSGEGRGGTGDGMSQQPIPEGGTKSPIGVVMFGTERVRAYMERLGVKIVEFGALVPQSEQAIVQRNFPGWYLSSIWMKLRDRGIAMPPTLAASIARYEAQSSGRISGDSIELRRALFGAILNDDTLGTLLAGKKGKPRLDLVRPARKLLRALAFIGLPTEREVLLLMPGLDHEKKVEVALDALHKASLVLKLTGYRSTSGERGDTIERYALHRSLLTELRHRYGIPLSEAKLSTAFNMSLFIAQPADGDIPDTDIHDQLGSAIDRLIGSYREPDPNDIEAQKSLDETLGEANGKQALVAAGKACGSSDMAADGGLTKKKSLDDMRRLCSRRHVQALRTALALVRSYYSTTGLLTLDGGDRLIAPGRDGVLREHAERLDELIDGYGKATLARESLRSTMTGQLDDEGKAFARLFGDVEPFYADELVWLHNERGVVRLAMGDLYEARRSFVQAMRVNRQCVEREDRGHNWRRVQLNNLVVDIERGQIGLAQRKCEELAQLIDKSKIKLREDRLAAAIVTGCQAWCMQLRGRSDQAIALYQKACNSLSKLHEVRAQAFFERLRADAMGSAKASPKERLAVIERALNLALSTKQMDLVHRLRITLADSILFGEEVSSAARKQQAHRYLEDALTYSLHTEVHRVRCEASMTTARARLSMSDYDGALRYASDAMMVATRHGMQLRKISLRSLLAQIMVARGHPITAEHLARTCIKMATRRGYQPAIDKASKVLADIPRMSAAIIVSDSSGRRNF